MGEEVDDKPNMRLIWRRVNTAGPYEDFGDVLLEHGTGIR